MISEIEKQDIIRQIKLRRRTIFSMLERTNCQHDFVGVSTTIFDYEMTVIVVWSRKEKCFIRADIPVNDENDLTFVSVPFRFKNP